MNNEDKKYYLYESTLTDIADSIRSKTGGTNSITPLEMSNEIGNIETQDPYKFFVDYYEIRYRETFNGIVKEIPNITINTTLSLPSFFSNCINVEKIGTITIDDASVACLNFQALFRGNVKLKSTPEIVFKNTTKDYMESTQLMFMDCTALENVIEYDLSRCINLDRMFANCPNINDNGLDNILKMCINAINSPTKTLAYLGLNASSYPTSRIETLPSYQDFIASGWTIGY